MMRRIFLIAGYCQYFFYAATALVVVDNPVSAYSSEVLKKSDSEKNNYYYAKNLEKLRKSVKPRFIRLLDSRNFTRNHTVVDSGVLFTYKNYQAKNVDFVCNLDRYQKHSMIRNEKGVWYYILPVDEYEEKTPEREILYKFVTDGLYIYDSTHENFEDDNSGGLLSKFTLTSDMMKAKEGVTVLGWETPNTKKVLFRLYAPHSRYVSLIGSFNNWDSETDTMKRTSDGYYEIIKSLIPGEYAYLFRIDGKDVVDVKSQELKYHPVFEKVGYFRIK